MIRLKLSIFILAISILQFGCGGKKNADPDPQIETPIQTEITNIFTDSVAVVQSNKFFELEQSMEDIQKEVEMLRNKVMDYEYKPPDSDYTKQLKALIDNPPPAHKISLKMVPLLRVLLKKIK